MQQIIDEKWPKRPMCWSKKYSLRQKHAPKIDVVDSMVAKKNKKKTFKDSDQNLDKALQNPNTKMIIDFEWEHSVSINSLAAN